MITKRSHPLGTLFRSQSDYIGHREDKKRMAIYRGFLQEGENLLNRCEMQKELRFEPDFFKIQDHQQLKRIVAASLQKIILDMTIKAIPAYAQFFEFSQQEFENLLTHLVTNSCSANITVMANQTIRNQLKSNFSPRNKYQFPSLTANDLFAQEINQINTLEGKREGEFMQTIQLFKSVCSWDNDANNMRLMVPLLRNPVIMAYVIRQMTGRQIMWEPTANHVYLADIKKSVKIHCRNMICRQTEQKEKLNSIPWIVGTDSITDSYQAIYCHDFFEVDYPRKDPIPQIRKLIRSRTFDQEKLMVAAMISLITKMPDLFLWSKTYKQGSKFLTSNIDQVWKRWAVKQSKRFAHELHYEEFLTLKKVDRNLYYDNLIPKFSVSFDINLGDLDRVTQTIGKLDISFHLHANKQYLKWIRQQWITLDPRDHNKKEQLLQSLRTRFQGDIAKAKKKFIIPPWKTGLDRLIVHELLEQLSLYQGNFFEHDLEKLVEIPVNLSYAPFALKYLRFLFLSKKASANQWLQ
ncbi:MAG: hypothetical protein HN730_06785 [Bdellovibrionales bacterium]|nr:hypothetical protein [Bdellovibrionales bacterium]MBT7766845.1 hypothetical protein [Bdellovibrionales bacterium]